MSKSKLRAGLTAISLSQYDAKMVTLKRRNKLWHRIRGAVDGYAIGIVRLIGESYSSETLLRRYLETCLATSPGFYEVFNCEPHVGFQTRDLVTGRECEVSEDLASTSLCDGEIMFAHLVPIAGTTMLEAISPLSFPPDFKRQLVQLTRTSSWKDLREVYFVLARPRLPEPSVRIN